MDKNQFRYEEAFDRNIGWLTLEEQSKLQSSCVLIAGLGGTGGFQAQVLARLGVGHFILVDPDTFEITNINRQIGASTHTIGMAKVEVVREMILAINPKAEVNVIPEPLTEENVDQVLEFSDFAIDGIDFFEIDAKMLLFTRCMQRGIPALTAAPIGFGVTLIVFSKQGMNPYDYFDITKGMPESDKRIAFAFGISPNPLCLKYMQRGAMNFEGQRASSVCPGLMLAGAISGAEAVKVLTGKGRVLSAPHVYQIDLLTQEVSKKYYRWGMQSPWMRLKRSFVKRIILKGKK